MKGFDVTLREAIAYLKPRFCGIPEGEEAFNVILAAAESTLSRKPPKIDREAMAKVVYHAIIPRPLLPYNMQPQDYRDNYIYLAEAVIKAYEDSRK